MRWTDRESSESTRAWLMDMHTYRTCEPLASHARLIRGSPKTEMAGAARGAHSHAPAASCIDTIERASLARGEQAHLLEPASHFLCRRRPVAIVHSRLAQRSGQYVPPRACDHARILRRLVGGMPPVFTIAVPHGHPHAVWQVAAHTLRGDVDQAAPLSEQASRAREGARVCASVVRGRGRRAADTPVRPAPSPAQPTSPLRA